MIAAALLAATLPFGPGESMVMKITYARLRAGRAEMTVEAAEHEGRPAWRIEQRVRSEGFFAWLFRYRVDNQLAASWDPASGCSYGLVKRLRQGRYARDQEVRIDPQGRVTVRNAGGDGISFAIEPCVLDVLSAFYVARARGLSAEGTVSVPVFDAGRRYALVFRRLGRTTLDVDALGGRVAVQVVEPLVPPGSGLFAQDGRLVLWVTDDERRIPVKAQSEVAVGSVTVELERYTPPR